MMNTLSISFILITVFTVLLLFIATGFDKKLMLIYVIWTVLVGVISYLGFFENTETTPPRFLFLMIPSVVITILVYRLLKNKDLSAPWLIGIHVVRIPVELILYGLYLENLIPELMTFSGWNWDILSGASAIIILMLLITNKLNRKLFLIWNWVALGLLAVIVVSAMLSAPLPFQVLAFDQPNLGVLRFPFTLLPAVVVPIVLLSHLCLIRMLNKENKLKVLD